MSDLRCFSPLFYNKNNFIFSLRAIRQKNIAQSAKNAKKQKGTAKSRKTIFYASQKIYDNRKGKRARDCLRSEQAH